MLPTGEFYGNRSNPDGLQFICKTCNAPDVKERYIKRTLKSLFDREGVEGVSRYIQDLEQKIKAARVILEGTEQAPMNCPLCGSHDTALSGRDDKRWIECRRCEQGGPSARTKEEAIAYWNLRPWDWDLNINLTSAQSASNPRDTQ
jgi:hypothetical protein